MSYKIKKKPESMRVKEIETKAEGRTCGECARGCWNEWNFNYRGKPFLIYCEHSTYARTRDGRGVCYDNTAACGKFTAGEKGGSK